MSSRRIRHFHTFSMSAVDAACQPETMRREASHSQVQKLAYPAEISQIASNCQPLLPTMKGAIIHAVLDRCLPPIKSCSLPACCCATPLSCKCVAVVQEQSSSVLPVIFFPVTPLRRIKMPSQVKIIKKWMSQGWGSGKQMLEPGKQD